MAERLPSDSCNCFAHNGEFPFLCRPAKHVETMLSKMSRDFVSGKMQVDMSSFHAEGTLYVQVQGEVEGRVSILDLVKDVKAGLSEAQLNNDVLLVALRIAKFINRRFVRSFRKKAISPSVIFDVLALNCKGGRKALEVKLERVISEKAVRGDSLIRLGFFRMEYVKDHCLEAWGLLEDWEIAFLADHLQVYGDGLWFDGFFLEDRGKILNFLNLFVEKKREYAFKIFALFLLSGIGDIRDLFSYLTHLKDKNEDVFLQILLKLIKDDLSVFSRFLIKSNLTRWELPGHFFALAGHFFALNRQTFFDVVSGHPFPGLFSFVLLTRAFLTLKWGYLFDFVVSRFR